MTVGAVSIWIKRFCVVNFKEDWLSFSEHGQCGLYVVKTFCDVIFNED